MAEVAEDSWRVRNLAEGKFEGVRAECARLASCRSWASLKRGEDTFYEHLSHQDPVGHRWI